MVNLRTNLNQLDLHSVRHGDVKVLIENYIYKESLPIRIITGHSKRMREIVIDTLVENGYEYEAVNSFPYITVLK